MMLRDRIVSSKQGATEQWSRTGLWRAAQHRGAYQFSSSYKAGLTHICRHACVIQAERQIRTTVTPVHSNLKFSQPRRCCRCFSGQRPWRRERGSGPKGKSDTAHGEAAQSGAMHDRRKSNAFSQAKRIGSQAHTYFNFTPPGDNGGDDVHNVIIEEEERHGQ